MSELRDIAQFNAATFQWFNDLAPFGILREDRDRCLAAGMERMFRNQSL
jgi:hypothetical protein